MTALEMPSDFEVPDLKKTLSARVRMSSHAKLTDIRELWKEKARATNQTQAVVDAIDTTFVVDQLLARACDDELKLWGGFAPTAEGKAEQLKKVREAAREVSKKR